MAVNDLPFLEIWDFRSELGTLLRQLDRYAEIIQCLG